MHSYVLGFVRSRHLDGQQQVTAQDRGDEDGDEVEWAAFPPGLQRWEPAGSRTGDVPSVLNL